MTWLEQTFGVRKPIIAMCHLQALPGDPSYDRAGGMAKVVELALQDLVHLQDGGVDAVMFSNEFSLPYLTKVRTETTAAMARVIGEIKHRITVPFGVNVLWDPIASIDLAAATGALFMREIITGVYASDFGLWNTAVGETIRHKMRLAPDLRMLFNIVPEAASYLGTRTVADIARSTVFNNRPDALCVSGLTAGAETDTPDAVAGEEPPFPTQWCFATRAAASTTSNGSSAWPTVPWWRRPSRSTASSRTLVDPSRVRAFMDKVRSVR